MIPGPGRWRRGSSSRLDGGMFIIVILMLCYLMLSFTGMVMRNNEHPNPIAIDSIITSTSPAAYQRVAYNTTMTNNNASMPDAKWVMVMSSHYEEYADVAYSNARAYAKKHDYDIYIHQSVALGDASTKEEKWYEGHRQKLLAILHAFDLNYEYVFWKDTDCIIMNCATSLDDIFEDGRRAHTVPWEDDLGGVDPFPSEMGPDGKAPLDAVFTSDDPDQLNSGNMLFRNTPWSRYVLHRTLAVFDGRDRAANVTNGRKRSRTALHGAPGPHTDQSALVYVLLGEPVRCRDFLEHDYCLFKCKEGGCEERFPYVHAHHFHISPVKDIAPRHKSNDPNIFIIHTAGESDKSKKTKVPQLVSKSSCHGLPT